MSFVFPHVRLSSWRALEARFFFSCSQVSAGLSFLHNRKGLPEQVAVKIQGLTCLSLLWAMLCPRRLPEERVYVDLRFQRMRVTMGMRRKQVPTWRPEQESKSSRLYFLNKAVEWGWGKKEKGTGKVVEALTLKLSTRDGPSSSKMVPPKPPSHLLTGNWVGQPNTQDYEAHCPIKAPQRASSFCLQINLDELKPILMGFVFVLFY